MPRSTPRHNNRSRRRVRQSRGHGAEPQIESLEPRFVLAVGQGYGTWSITGDSNAADPDDIIIIDRNPSNAAQLRATIKRLRRRHPSGVEGKNHPHRRRRRR